MNTTIKIVRRIARFIRRPAGMALTAAIAAAAVASAYVGFRGDRLPDTVTVKRGIIVQEVIVTGKTEATLRIDLAFERAGKVTRVNAAVGDRVHSGATLAALDERGLAADLAEAEANLAAQEARLSNAELAVSDAERGMRDKIQDAYTKSDDAVRNRADQFFSSPRSANPQVNFAADPYVENALENERVAIELLLDSWQPVVTGVATGADLTPAAERAQSNLARVRLFLDQAALALASLQPSVTLTRVTIDGWRADISTARTNVNTAVSNLSSAEERIKNAPGETAVRKAERDAAEARTRAIRVELSKTILTAPMSGIVAKQDAKVGQIASANAIVASLISEQGFTIEANVPEVDIASIGLGNPVVITIDALGAKAQSGRVTHVDPGETIIDGVVNFKVTVALENSDPRLKSGLTANLAIRTLEKSDVLVLPQYALIERDRGTFARLAERRDPGQTDREVLVVTGIRGQDGMVEIVSGLNEGDRVENIGRKPGGQP